MAMSMQGSEQKRNRRALASVIWGVAGALLWFNGSTSLILILAAVAGVIAIWSGAGGLRKAREMGQRGRIWALAGIVIGGIDLLVVVVRLLPTG